MDEFPLSQLLAFFSLKKKYCFFTLIFGGYYRDMNMHNIEDKTFVCTQLSLKKKIDGQEERTEVLSIASQSE